MFSKFHGCGKYLNPSRNLNVQQKRIFKCIKKLKYTNTKPKAIEYFTKLEIATLFFQPMAVILLYFGLSWKLLQYTCDISSVSYC